MLTPEKLKELGGRHSKDWILEGIVEYSGLLEDYEIHEGVRRQMFFAQLAHESDGFKTTEEYASGRAYEGRSDLGNTEPGDGTRFKGRGLIQLTGRANYEAYDRFIHANYNNDTNYVENPEEAAQFPAALHSALWFWHTRNLNTIADDRDFKKITRRINGGYNGLESRLEYLRRAEELEL